jgi:VanZ family protein
MKKLVNGKIPAYGWFLFTTVLLLLPGSAMPHETWLSKIYFDKIAHLFFFGMMVWLFCRSHFRQDDKEKKSVVGYGKFVFYLIVFIAYGIAIEFIQKNFIPNRSFDVGDIAADAAGAIAGFLFSGWLYVKRVVE